MDKKRIQEERKKSYFIEAAKKIIKEDGVNDLTVKKVADLAGYAPGTLYNYFSDLKTLLFYCVVDFFNESKELLLKELDNSTTSEEKVINFTKIYSGYFIENPNIYQLLFLEDLGEHPEEFSGDDGYVPEVVKLSKRNLIECAKEGIIKNEEVDVILALISNTIHGNLLFYFKRRNLMNEKEVLEKIETEVKYLLQKVKQF